MYPEIMVIPMREELVRAGIQGNPHCRGRRCSSRTIRHNPFGGELDLWMRCRQDAPGVRLALSGTQIMRPDHKITVFAGQDREATERARSYFEGNPPTSPAIAILRDGKLVYLMQRFVIEQATAQQIATANWFALSISSAPKPPLKLASKQLQQKRDGLEKGGKMAKNPETIPSAAKAVLILLDLWHG